jgi:antitoxin (DNA-binding transcriptional repressor) of toxin-antitoxin stability system
LSLLPARTGRHALYMNTARQEFSLTGTSLRRDFVSLIDEKFIRFNVFDTHKMRKGKQGQTVEIMKSGKPVARLTPSPGRMTGKEYAAILRGHKPDPKTAAEVQRILKEQDEHERAIFDRH